MLQLIMIMNMKTTDDTSDIYLMVATLPVYLQEALRGHSINQLIEVVMDLGRPPEARFEDRSVLLAERAVSREDMDHVLALVGDFSDDNRAGIERTLHRISAIRNRKGLIIGLTLRVGRAVFGTIDLLRDLMETGRNMLIMGRPGVGKTTKLREMARVLADDFHKRVIVVDTSNEIGGDGDIPHPAIGGARRMQVSRPDRQHAVMIEAVENHMPEVIIVDEIGTEAEAAAARTIAERGVQLIGTAHGKTLENLIVNPTLSDLIGGVQTVTLGDDEARRRRTTKTVNERRSSPTFDIVVEMVTRDEVVVHKDTAEAVDTILLGGNPGGERRKRDGDGRIYTEEVKEPGISPSPLPEIDEKRREGPVRIYPYGVSRDLLERVIRDLQVEARVVGRIEWADMILALRARSSDAQLKRILKDTDLPVHLVKNNSTAQIKHSLQSLFFVFNGMDDDEVRDAARETEFAIQRVLSEGAEVALTPRRAALRRMQHRMIARYNLHAESVGSEPARHLVIQPE